MMFFCAQSCRATNRTPLACMCIHHLLFIYTGELHTHTHLWRQHPEIPSSLLKLFPAAAGCGRHHGCHRALHGSRQVVHLQHLLVQVREVGGGGGELDQGCVQVGAGSGKVADPATPGVGVDCSARRSELGTMAGRHRCVQAHTTPAAECVGMQRLERVERKLQMLCC